MSKQPGRTNPIASEYSADLRPIPSQAEGEDKDEAAGARSGNDNRPVPSQAEGDEETIDESLRQKRSSR